MTTKAKTRKYKREWDREHRKGHPVGFRLNEEELAELDEVRGEQSRAAYLKAIVLAAINRRKGKG